MTDIKEIRYIKHIDIDSVKWNRCIDNSPNALIYAYFWYLNLVCNNWDAIVYGNYEYVMPVPIRYKFGINYVYQPYFAQQLGIFPAPSEKIQEYFSGELFKQFRLINYQINAQLNKANFSSFTLSERVNLVLTLSENYETISDRYTAHTKRNINKANKLKTKVSREISSEDYFNSFKSRYPLASGEMNRLKQIVKSSQKNGTGEFYGVFSTNNNLCAAVFFLRSNKRVVLLSSFSIDEGRKNRSMFAIIDNFIQHNSNTALLLDFEGSNKESLARFYGGFGAQPEYYYHISSNKLPSFLKLFKR